TTTPWNRQPVDSECAEATRAAGRLCERLGHHVEEASPDIDAKALSSASFLVVCANIRAGLQSRAARRPCTRGGQGLPHAAPRPPTPASCRVGCANSRPPRKPAAPARAGEP